MNEHRSPKGQPQESNPTPNLEGIPLENRELEHVRTAQREAMQDVASNEVRESAEQNKMDTAIQQAIDLGIIERKTVGNPDHKKVYLLFSTHPDFNDSSTILNDDESLENEWRKYQLVYLVHQVGVKSPVHIEGRLQGKQYYPTPNLCVESGNPVFSEAGQTELFSSKESFKALIQQQLTYNPHHQPSFFQYSNHAFEGAHSKQTEQCVEEFSIKWIPVLNGFDKKFRPLLEQSIQEGVFTVSHGWDQSGLPVIKIGDEWYYAQHNFVDSHASNTPMQPGDSIAKNCQDYLKCLQKLDEVSSVRDQDIVNILHNVPSNTVGIAAYGIGHMSQQVQLCLQRQLQVEVLTTPGTATTYEQFTTQKTAWELHNGHFAQTILDCVQSMSAR